MTGPNLELYREVVRRYPELVVQASGGVSGLFDLQKLSETGVDFAVTGKALLEGCFTVADAIRALA
jgi:phosphoribosylformimino-5-aminoimidazole carboxamide ribotide isomerase